MYFNMLFQTYTFSNINHKCCKYIKCNIEISSVFLIKLQRPRIVRRLPIYYFGT